MFLAIATAFILQKAFGAPGGQGRYSQIDGLRGYLAFFVFLYHARVWFLFLHTGRWEVPPSNLFTHLGQSSVLLFFMITGFLFFSKLIDGRTKGIDWGKLFVSRFLRLVPLYLFAILLLFTIVAYFSKGLLHEPIGMIFDEVLEWLTFTIAEAPIINAIGYTKIIVAGVTWSLPYEWLFYFSLPILALTVGVIPPLRYLALSLVGVIVLILFHSQFYTFLLLSFLGGILPSFLVRSKVIRQFATKNISSLIVLGCLVTMVFFYKSPYGTIQLILLFSVFALIACGNDFFGLLVTPTSRTLGEMAYSIYLLHGITLFVTFILIIGKAQSKVMSPTIHWLVVETITPVLILVCFLTFRFIEYPAMRSTSACTAWLRSLRTRLS